MTDATHEPDPALHIDLRSGLPDEWTFLLKQYPRETWMVNTDLGEHTRFWLSIHRHFRQMAAHLTSVSSDYREGHVDARAFRARLAPRLQQFLGTLDHHHRSDAANRFSH